MEPKIHPVVEGDTLSSLARKYGTTIESFVQANPDKIKDINKIYIGQKLNVPTATGITPLGEGTSAQIKSPSVSPDSSTSKVQGGIQPTSGVEPGNQPAIGMPSMGFYFLVQQMKEKLNKNQDLIDRKNKILTHLYDRPLTDEEKKALAPSDIRAMESNNRSLVDLSLRMINDELKGRVDSVSNAFEFLTTGYKTEMATLEKKADNYRQQMQWALTNYGKNALKALLPGGEGIDYEKLAGLEPAGAKKDTADIENYNYYVSQEKAAGRTPVSFFEFSKSGADQFFKPTAEMKSIASTWLRNQSDFTEGDLKRLEDPNIFWLVYNQAVQDPEFQATMGKLFPYVPK